MELKGDDLNSILFGTPLKCITKKDWQETFPFVIKDVPITPSIVKELLKKCPFSDNNERVFETHLFALIPD